MRAFKIALLATAATVAFSSTAFAADLMLDVPEAPVMDSGFDWEGAYIGAFISGQSVPSTGGLGFNIGFNTFASDILFGGEFEASWLSDNSWTAQFDGRVGVLFSQDALVYGFAGIGNHSANDAFVPLGVGVEFALADELSLKAEYQYNYDLDSSAEDANVFKVGLNFGF